MMKVSAILTGLMIAATIAAGQNAATKGAPSPGSEDVGDLKVQAERGVPQAQIKLAEAYLANGRPADARRWYAAAAGQNSAEGQFQLGNLLLTGRSSALPNQSLTADPAAALNWIYMAATNGHKSAWRSLAHCLQSGNNCATNLSEAYAWLTLLADAGDNTVRTEMNRLALDLSSEDIQAGKAVFAAMKTGRWPLPPAAENSRLANWLHLQGVSISTREKLAIIGNRTLAEGEQAYVSAGGQWVRLTCLSIGSNSVQVQIEGEARPRTLRTPLGTAPIRERK